MRKNLLCILVSTSFAGAALAGTEEKIHKLSDLGPRCKQLSAKVFDCLPAECTFVDSIDGVSSHWTISVVGPQKKLCKITATFDNPDVTKSNTFTITKLERNNLAAYLREYFAKTERTIIREQTCCSESKAVKNFCYVSVNGKRFLDILDDRPYFGCDGSKLFEVEQNVVAKNRPPESMPLPGPDTAPVSPPPDAPPGPPPGPPPGAPPTGAPLPPPSVESLPPPSM